MASIVVTKKSMSFLEILVAALLLATVMGGVLASFVSVRGMISRSTRRLSTVNTARFQLDEVYDNLSQLNNTNSKSGLITMQYPQTTYSWNYTPEHAPNTTAARKVNIEVGPID